MFLRLTSNIAVAIVIFAVATYATDQLSGVPAVVSVPAIACVLLQLIPLLLLLLMASVLLLVSLLPVFIHIWLSNHNYQIFLSYWTGELKRPKTNDG